MLDTGSQATFAKENLRVLGIQERKTSITVKTIWD